MKIQEAKPDTLIGFLPIITEVLDYKVGLKKQYAAYDIHIVIPTPTTKGRAGVSVKYFEYKLDLDGTIESVKNMEYNLTSGMKPEIWEYDMDPDTGVVDYNSGVKISDAVDPLNDWDTLLRPFLSPAVINQMKTRNGY